MPPTRGHDLKLERQPGETDLELMPPTRGHDLKQQHGGDDAGARRDAPHTGAGYSSDAADE